MRKLASSSNVALSFGRRGWKRITPSLDSTEPAKITSPSTSSAFAKIEPMIDVRRDDDLAGREREDDDEELGQVAERRLQQPGHRRPEALADLLRRERDDPREPRERERRDAERQERRRPAEVRDACPEGDCGDEHGDDPGAAHPGTLGDRLSVQRRTHLRDHLEREDADDRAGDRRSRACRFEVGERPLRVLDPALVRPLERAARGLLEALVPEDRRELNRLPAHLVLVAAGERERNEREAREADPGLVHVEVELRG